MSQTDLIHLLHTHNFITRPLGVNILSKISKSPNNRLPFFLVLLWLDTLYTALIPLIPTSEEKLLLTMGDFAFHLVHQKRYFMVFVMLFYRLSSSFMVSSFALDDFQWLHQANRIFNQLSSPRLVRKLIRWRNRCRVITLVSSVVLESLIISALAMSILIYWERNAKYFLIPAYAYICYYAIMYTSVHCQFMMELFFLCKICVELFDDINWRLETEMLRTKAYHLFSHHYRNFSHCCLFTNHITLYIERLYIIFFVCNLTVVVLLFYSALYANFNLISQSIYIVFLIVQLAFIVYFSHIIGSIDVKAKQMCDQVYDKFIIKRNDHFSKSFRNQLLRYFQTVFGSTISMVILESAINSNTSIKILTILLAVTAFLMSRFNRND